MTMHTVFPFVFALVFVSQIFSGDKVMGVALLGGCGCFSGWVHALLGGRGHFSGWVRLL